MSKIAAVRVRGEKRVSKKVIATLNMLRLYNSHNCVILPSNPSIIGMIKKVKDYITYGEVSEEVEKLLFEKRGKEYKGRLKDKKGKIDYKKWVVFGNKKYKPFFRLSPPRKGFERKGIKMPFKVGGALGYRADKINDLIKRMV